MRDFIWLRILQPTDSLTKTVKVHNGIRWGWSNEEIPGCPPNTTYYEPAPYTIGGHTYYYGGYCEDNEPGLTQENPILPNASDFFDEWQIFNSVPSGYWYDPPTTYGFEFQALGDTLFTNILDFPIGEDNRFTVSVGNRILGEFGPGNSVDFVDLLGQGVSNFKITDIDSLSGSDEATAFPIKLKFNEDVGSFQMRPFAQSQAVPEPSSVVGTLALGILGTTVVLKRRKKSKLKP